LRLVRQTSSERRHIINEAAAEQAKHLILGLLRW